MGSVEVSGVGYRLPDGRPLLQEVTFRVGDGAKAALIGANGCGKTTLLRLIAGDLPVDAGAIIRDGSVGVLRQFIGTGRGVSTVRDLLVSAAPRRIRAAAEALDRAELAMMDDDHEATARLRRGTGAAAPRSDGCSREQAFDTLSGGQQARFQILLLELSGATMRVARRTDRQPRRRLSRGPRSRDR